MAERRPLSRNPATSEIHAIASINKPASVFIGSVCQVPVRPFATGIGFGSKAAFQFIRQPQKWSVRGLLGIIALVLAKIDTEAWIDAKLAGYRVAAIETDRVCG